MLSNRLIFSAFILLFTDLALLFIDSRIAPLRFIFPLSSTALSRFKILHETPGGVSCNEAEEITMSQTTAQQILGFWFEEIEPRQWWVKDDAFDRLIKGRFGELLKQAAQGELYLWRSFLLRPYMHSESKLIHQLAEELYRLHAPDNNYQFELKHKAIIDRFGRYPHRNAILGRQSSAAELAFLQLPGSGF
jgi:uncharacterized protein (DUF924 family)